MFEEPIVPILIGTYIGFSFPALQRDEFYIVTVPIYHDEYILVASSGSDWIPTSHVHGELVPNFNEVGRDGVFVGLQGSCRLS